MEKMSAQAKKSKDILLIDGIEEFKRNCKVRNLSLYTMRYYSGLFHVIDLITPLEKTCIKDINEDFIYKFITHMQDVRKVKDTTVASYMKGIKTIFYFFMKKEYMEKFHIYIPAVDKPLKDTYTEKELEVLLKKPNIKKCSFCELRSWAMIVYFVGTGQRLRTVLNLKNEDLDLNNGIVKLKAVKNRKQTILSLPSQVVETLYEYMRIRGGEKEDFLFCKNNGLELSKRGAEEAIKRYNYARNVERTSIHAFRHTFARNYLLAGGDVFRLQRLMCHSDISVKKEYLNLTVEDLAMNFDNLTSLRNISTKKIKIKR